MIRFSGLLAVISALCLTLSLNVRAADAVSSHEDLIAKLPINPAANLHDVAFLDATFGKTTIQLRIAKTVDFEDGPLLGEVLINDGKYWAHLGRVKFAHGLPNADHLDSIWFSGSDGNYPSGLHMGDVLFVKADRGADGKVTVSIKWRAYPAPVNGKQPDPYLTKEFVALARSGVVDSSAYDYLDK